MCDAALLCIRKVPDNMEQLFSRSLLTTISLKTMGQ